MLGLVYITYTDGLVLSGGLGSRELRATDVKRLSLSGGCIFADLEDIGVIILHFLDSWGIKFEYHGVKLNIVYIDVGRLRIKNSTLFDIDLGSGYASANRSLIELRVILMERLGLSIHDRRVNSLAAVSTLLLKKEAPCALGASSGGEEVLGAGYFGGRREAFSNGQGSTRYYDFPSMYSKIQCEQYPTHYEMSPTMGVGLPGFYSVKFEYLGGGAAPRLPVRNGNGEITYQRSGEGLFWYEEILAFEQCGGRVVSVHSCIEARGMGNYLRGVNEYLLAKRGSGNKMAKGLANRIYGRLALSQTHLITRYKRLDPSTEFDELQYKSYKRFRDSVVYEDVGFGRPVERNIGWASIITARGRAKLMRLMHECELSGYELTCVNTDSVEIRSDKDVVVCGILFKERGH